MPYHYHSTFASHAADIPPSPATWVPSCSILHSRTGSFARMVSCRTLPAAHLLDHATSFRRAGTAAARFFAFALRMAGGRHRPLRLPDVAALADRHCRCPADARHHAANASRAYLFPSGRRHCLHHLRLLPCPVFLPVLAVRRQTRACRPAPARRAYLPCRMPCRYLTAPVRYGAFATPHSPAANLATYCSSSTASSAYCLDLSCSYLHMFIVGHRAVYACHIQYRCLPHTACRLPIVFIHSQHYLRRPVSHDCLCTGTYLTPAANYTFSFNGRYASIRFTLALPSCRRLHAPPYTDVAGCDAVRAAAASVVLVP